MTRTPTTARVGPPPGGGGPEPVPPGADTREPVARGRLRGVLPSLWRLLLRVRYHLFQRHRHGRLVVEEVVGRRIVVLPGVFNPKLFVSGELLARTLDAKELVPEGCSVLDLGTGSGAAAVVAARRAGHVTAVDIDPRAVRCARVNATIHEVEERIEVLEGDLFAPVAGRRFDVVTFNPPFYRGVPRRPDEWAWRSEDVPERFARGLADHLNEGGRAYVVLSSEGDGAGALEAFRSAGLRWEAVGRRIAPNEALVVYRVVPGLVR